MGWKDIKIIGTSEGVSDRSLDIPTSPHLDRALADLHSKGHHALIVGGAVRDALLGEEPKDVDVEVYGTNYDELASVLRKHGKTNLVGKAFGVVKFTDKDRNEYDFSLPRRDNKTGVGHRDFATEFDPTIEPREAASRRDFTINALAYDPVRRKLHDYFGGEQDLKDRVIRHTSEAFSEDPLRVLRGMQFAARYGMDVAPETAELAKSIRHEYSTIPKERVSEEFMKLATKGKEPGRAMDYLEKTGWSENFPELHAMRGTPQEPDWHPEGDLHEHTKHAMNSAAKIADREGLGGDDRATVVFGAMCHDLGKPGTTSTNDQGQVISHGHAEAGEVITRKFLKDIGIKQDISDKVAPIVGNHMQHLNYERNISSRTVRRLAERLHPATIKELAHVMEADHSGRPPLPGGLPAGAQKMLDKAAESDVTTHKVDRLIKGRDVMPYFNNEPGPHIGEHVKAAYEAQLNGEISTREEGLAWLKNRFSKTAKTSRIWREDLPVEQMSVDHLIKNMDGGLHTKEECQNWYDKEDHGEGEGEHYDSRDWDYWSSTVRSGIGEPIYLTRYQGKYSVDDGNHRLAWAVEQGLKTVPVQVEPVPKVVEAAWRDVRDKAVRLRNANMVEIIRIDDDVIASRVQGDHHRYDVVLYRQYPGSWAITIWECSCKWGEWAFKRQRTFVGRMCSHALATLYEAHSKEYTKPKSEEWEEGDTVQEIADRLGSKWARIDSIKIAKDGDPPKGTGYFECFQCGGTGSFVACGNCKGDGFTNVHEDNCEKCGGTGKGTDIVVCDTCHGSGVMRIVQDERGMRSTAHDGQVGDLRHLIQQHGADPRSIDYTNSAPEDVEWVHSQVHGSQREAMARLLEHEVPKKLRDTIKAFRKNNPNLRLLEHPEGAWGYCNPASDSFATFALGRGHDAKTFTVSDNKKRDVPKNVHTMNKVDGVYVDWSARQYDPDAPVPAVFTDEMKDQYFPHPVKVTSEDYPQSMNQLGEHLYSEHPELVPKGGFKMDDRNVGVEDPRVFRVGHEPLDIPFYRDDEDDAVFEYPKVHSIREDTTPDVRPNFHPGSMDKVDAIMADRDWLREEMQSKTATYERPQKLWHVTERKNRESIQEHGLDPNKNEVFGQYGGYKHTWAFDHPKKALDMAQRMSEWAKGTRDYDVWEVDSSGLDVIPDPHGNYHNSWAIIGPTPPERLKLQPYEEGGEGRQPGEGAFGFWNKYYEPVAKVAGYGRGKAVFKGAGRQVVVDVEVARDATTISQGLMNRYYLGPREGMVFIYPYPPSFSSFWMMNTFIPLSIAFWDREGRIIEIKDMEPCSPGTSRCPTYKCSKPYWGAIEVNRGFFETWQIRPGDRVELHL